MTQSTPELLPIEADIRAALQHLGWDDYDEFCEWAVSNHEMDRFDQLVQAFARHRIEHSTPDRNAVLEAHKHDIDRQMAIANSECQRAEEAIAMLGVVKEALEPFAEEAGNYDYSDTDGVWLPDYEDSPDGSSLNEMNDLTVGHLRRARAAIQTINEGE